MKFSSALVIHITEVNLEFDVNLLNVRQHILSIKLTGNDYSQQLRGLTVGRGGEVVSKLA